MPKLFTLVDTDALVLTDYLLPYKRLSVYSRAQECTFTLQDLNCARHDIFVG